jgi:hypothetical protein
MLILESEYRTRHICNGAQPEQQWIGNGAFEDYVALGTEL